MDREVSRQAKATVLAGAILLGALLLVLLLVELREILAVLFLGVVVGITLSPLAGYFARFGIPRFVSVLLVYATIVGGLTAFLWWAIPDLANDVERMVDEAAAFEQRYVELAEDSPLPPIEDVRDFLGGQLGNLAATVAQRALVVFTTLLYLFTIFVVALFFTVGQESARTLVISLAGPERRDRVGEVLDILGQRLRGFMLGEFITMLFVGIVTYVGLLIIGVPFPLLLASLAFIFEIVPIVGPFVAWGPAFLVALTVGWETALVVSIFYLILQQVESHVVVPVVQRRRTKVPELLIVSAILIGGALMGVLGALVALPAVVILHALTMEVVVPWRRQKVGWTEEEEREYVAERDPRGGADEEEYRPKAPAADTPARRPRKAG